jgi:hypothetical protein
MRVNNSKSAADVKKDALLRMKKFEALARKPGTTAKDLEKFMKSEPEADNQKKMKALLSRFGKSQGASSSTKMPAAAAISGPATPPGKKAADEQEALRRLKKFEAMAKKNAPDVRTLEKMEKTESDPNAKLKMKVNLKKLSAKMKNTSAVATAKPMTSAVAATPTNIGGPSKLPDPAAGQKRLQKFTADARKGKIDLAKLEKVVRMEKDAQVKRQMEKELALAKKKAGKK